MSDHTRQMIKKAVENVAFTKVALTPAVGGQVPPPPQDPAMGAPPGPEGAMPPGMPPGMPPEGGMPPGMPPMDPSMMGPPPGEGAPPEGGAAPMDPAAMGAPPEEGGPEDPNDPADDQNHDGKRDTMVPLDAITNHTVQVIEATKGKRTADAAPPKAPGAGGAAPGGPVGSLGGAPSAPMPLPGLGPKTASARLEDLISSVKIAKRNH